MIRLSKTQIHSFVGDIIPLRLLGVSAFGLDPIRWHLSGNCVQMRTFSPDVCATWYGDLDPFTDGILLTLCSPGQAVVTAVYEGTEYSCNIYIRERKVAQPDDLMQYYLGDMHIHTSTACAYPNGREILTGRTDGSSIKRPLSMMHEEGKLDATVVSDHACFLNRKEFFSGFTTAEEICGEDLIVFPGAESEINQVEKDRYGVVRLNAGEIVTHNTDEYLDTRNWDAFLAHFSKSPYMFCTLAHPHIRSMNTKGHGDFSLRRNNTPRFRQMLRYVEMGNGTDREGNLLNEHMYSYALDNGFHVSTTCSSDAHSGTWGFNRMPGKTIIMAAEKSREAFLDAFLSCRAYGSMSGNVKLHYTVNGHTAPTTLPWATKYRFEVQISYFQDRPDTVICGGEVISDGGIPIKELSFSDFSSFSFDIESNTASWFYLRLWDSEGRKTWSVPVWTGREPFLSDTTHLVPLDKQAFTALDETGNTDASVLINDDPYCPWKSNACTASILIDMQEEKYLRGLGYYPRILLGAHMKETGQSIPEFLAEFPCQFIIYTAGNDKIFQKRAEGVFRSFSNEEVISFTAHNARYIRLEILSSIGKYSKRKDFANARIAIAELTPYTELIRNDMLAYYVDKLNQIKNPLIQSDEHQ